MHNKQKRTYASQKEAAIQQLDDSTIIDVEEPVIQQLEDSIMLKTNKPPNKSSEPEEWLEGSNKREFTENTINSLNSLSADASKIQFKSINQIPTLL
ncbi:hypothetical protein RhiirA4_478843 [Rhizophagus irregularis]|uniref:Uncharacterized protein n=1 Tax=Rhizophagus irregularis TaxID=588596 RepID=A0A2I1HFI0_9GLOM|nr:hypothetical protein RhiirA4_478843 [Rhizophagus irregularis]